jgi:hypothetical protein
MLLTVAKLAKLGGGGGGLCPRAPPAPMCPPPPRSRYWSGFKSGPYGTGSACDTVRQILGVCLFLGQY